MLAQTGSILAATRTEPVGPFAQFLLTVVTLVIGGVIVLVGVGYLRTYLRVRGSDPGDIRRLTETDGAVELVGTVEVHEGAIRSPFTDTACVGVDWEVTEKHNDDSITLDTGETKGPFVLSDGTGRALVDPAGATIEMLTEEAIHVGVDETPPPTVEAFLDGDNDIDQQQYDTRHFEEQRIDVGEDVHVFGPVREVGHAADMPGGVDVVVGVEDPNRGFTIGEDGLSDLIEQIKSDTTEFRITTGDEATAERNLLKRGAVITVFGALFALLPLGYLLL